MIDTQYATNSIRVAETNCYLVLVLLHFPQAFQYIRRQLSARQQPLGDAHADAFIAAENVAEAEDEDVHAASL